MIDKYMYFFTEFAITCSYFHHLRSSIISNLTAQWKLLNMQMSDTRVTKKVSNPAPVRHIMWQPDEQVGVVWQEIVNCVEANEGVVTGDR